MPQLVTTVAITTLYRAPFATGPVTKRTFDPSTTIAEMVDDMEFLPADFHARGTLIIVGHRQEIELDRSQWHRIRLKPGQKLQCHYALQRGGDDGGGGKAVLGVILAVATILTAGAVAAFGIPGLVAAGSWQASLIATGAAVDGSSLKAALQ